MDAIKIFKVFLLIFATECVYSAHILGVPHTGKSHGFVFMKIGRELVKRGHRFSLVVPSALENDLKPKQPTKGLQVVSFESNFTQEALERLMMKMSQGTILNIFSILVRPMH